MNSNYFPSNGLQPLPNFSPKESDFHSKEYGTSKASRKAKGLKTIKTIKKNSGVNPKSDIKISNLANFAIFPTFTIYDQEYKIEKLGAGKHHIAYRFVENDSITVNNKTIQLEETVLKIPSPTRNPRDQRVTTKKSIAAYKYLESEGIPQAEAYVRPDSFADKLNPRKSGGFWIVEKMDSAAKITNPVVMTFVKHWLTETAKAGKEIIGDFRPDNVMVKNDQCYIIDPTSPQKCKGERFVQELNRTVKRWIGDQEAFFKDLTENFPEEIKEKMKTLENESAPNPFSIDSILLSLNEEPFPLFP